MMMFLILSEDRLRVRMVKNELIDDIDALKEKYMEDVTSLYVSLGDEIDFRSSMMHLIRALDSLNRIEAKQQRLFFLEMHGDE